MIDSNVVALINELDKTASLLEEAASTIGEESVSKVAWEFDANVKATAFLDRICQDIGI